MGCGQRRCAHPASRSNQRTESGEKTTSRLRLAHQSANVEDVREVKGQKRTEDRGQSLHGPGVSLSLRERERESLLLCLRPVTRNAESA